MFERKLRCWLSLFLVGVAMLGWSQQDPKPEIKQKIEAALKLPKTEVLAELARIADKAKELKDIAGEISAWMNAGDTARQYGLPAEAMTNYQRAQELGHSAGLGSEEATALRKIGIIFSDRKAYSEALAVYDQALPIARAAGDRQGEAFIFNNIGAVYLRQGKNDEALTSYDQALKIFTSLGTVKEIARVNFGIGSAYRSLRQFDRAIGALQKALETYRSVQMPEAEADVERQIGYCYRDLGKRTQALEYFDPAIKIYHSLKILQTEAELEYYAGLTCRELSSFDRALTYYRAAFSAYKEVHSAEGVALIQCYIGDAYMAEHQWDLAEPMIRDSLEGYLVLKMNQKIADVKGLLGHIYLNRTKVDQAIALYQEALTTYNALKLNADAARIQSDIGIAYSQKGDTSQALSNLEASLQSYRELNMPAEVARVEGNIGFTYRAGGQSEKAIAHFEAALAGMKGANFPMQAAEIQESLGIAYGDLGQNEQALTNLQAARKVFQELNLKSKVADSDSRIGTVYRTQGDNDAALSRYLAAVESYKSLKLPKESAETAELVGAVLRHQGRFENALEVLKSALTVFEKLKIQREVAGVTSQIAFVYKDLGQSARAISLYQAAEEIYRTLNDERDVAAMQCDLGILFNNTLQYDQGLLNSQKAFETFRRLKLPIEEAQAQGAMAMNYVGLGKYDLAVDNFQLAVKTLDRLGRPQEAAQEKLTIAPVALRAGEIKFARELYLEVLPIFKTGSDRRREAWSLSGLGECYFLSGNREVGVALGKQAVNLMQQVRSEFSQNPTAQAGLGPGERRSLAEEFSEYFVRLASELASEGRTTEVQQVLAMSKSDGSGQQTEKASLNDKEARWLANYDKRAGTDLPQYLAEIVQESSRVSSPITYALLTEESRRVDAALSAAPPGTTAIYVLSDKNTVQELVLKKGRRWIEIHQAVGIKEKIKSFLSILQDPNRDPRPVGKEIYDALVKPILAYLDPKGVTMWSLSGDMRGLPIDALWDGSKFLIDRFFNSYFTPGFVPGFIASHKQKGAALVFGATRAAVVKDPITEESIDFPSLPGVAKETAGVATSLHANARLDGDFTSKNLLEGFKSKPTIVHLASHFRYVPGDDRRSFLLAGDGSILSIDKMKELPSDAMSSLELVTLSACATSSGESASGEEVESFAAWMQRKGAKSVLSTLWPVADASTWELMTRFYRLMQEKPSQTKVSCLREAQTSMMQGVIGGSKQSQRGSVSPTKGQSNSLKAPLWPGNLPKYSHPYYWAPFVLTGNWQ